MSYHEKSTWVSLVSAIIIFGLYFGKAVTVMAQDQGNTSILITYFIAAVILSIVIQVLAQIIFAILDRAASERGLDERDKHIEQRTRTTAYYVLVVGIWCSVASQLWDSRPVVLINLLMASFVISEVVAYVSKLWIYRRGY